MKTFEDKFPSLEKAKDKNSVVLYTKEAVQRGCLDKQIVKDVLNEEFAEITENTHPIGLLEKIMYRLGL